MIYLDHLLKATRGQLYTTGKHTQFNAFSHDTRQLQPGEMFVAVRGVRSDGHDFLLDAIRAGAYGLLIEARTFNHLSEHTQIALAGSAITIVIVEDTRLALQQYTSTILDLWHPTVIAVTGSVGKTSTKEAIASVLASQFTTFRSWQNYNDLLGIPLSLGHLEARHEYAVLELSCDHPGEIADLCRITHPQIGVLTNISPVQLQYFNSIEHLAMEFGMLLTSLPPEGHFFYNQEDALIRTLLDQYKQTAHPTASLHPFYPATLNSELAETIMEHTSIHVHVDWDGIRGEIPVVPNPATKTGTASGLTGETTTLSSHLLGAHHISTMLAAYQVALCRGIHPDKARYALKEDVHPLSGRLNPLPGIRNSYLLDDTHNASPASMIAGLSTLSTLTPEGGQRIAVLGDMLYLGDYEAEAHRYVGKHIPEYVDYLITRGDRATILAEAARNAGMDEDCIIMTSTHEDAAQAVRRILDQWAPQEEPVHMDHRRLHLVLIKGSEETRMERVTELLMARPWEASEKLVRQTPGWKKTIFKHAERPTWVEVDLNAIGSNTRHIKSIVGPDTQVLVALKADAYGHGALKVARTVLQNGATMLGVATVSEAIPLREAKITAPILVFGYVPHWQMREAIRSGVTVTLYDQEAAHTLSHTALELGKTVRVHIKVDTGMGRLGIRHEQIEEIIDLARTIKVLPGLELEGLYMHFAQADAEDRHYTNMQLARFQRVIQELEQQELRPPLVHAANSAAMLTLPESHFDMVRPGVAVYGLAPSSEVRLPEGFRAALSFKTQVSQVKWIPKNEGISYGSTYITQRPTCIAVLPVGYADGFRRAPRNWGSVLIHGQEAPILGRVCMDQCMVDVTHIPETRMGDEVVLIGHQEEATLTTEQVAERLGTISYEVVSEILARVPRVD